MVDRPLPQLLADPTALEAQGFKVANVKVYPAASQDFGRRVFKNPHPSSREDAEWVVTMFQEGGLHPEEVADLEGYSFPGEDGCHKPTDIPKAKIVLEDVGK